RSSNEGPHLSPPPWGPSEANEVMHARCAAWCIPALGPPGPIPELGGAGLFPPICPKPCFKATVALAIAGEPDWWVLPCSARRGRFWHRRTRGARGVQLGTAPVSGSRYS